MSTSGDAGLGVGPVLHATPFARSVVSVIEEENTHVLVQDEGAYLRVLVPWVCRLSRAGLEAATGFVIRFPGEEKFLLSVLAQLCGTVIAKLELLAAERANIERVASLNADLESTVSALKKIMETHRHLNEIVANAGEAGIAKTLHQLSGFPVLIQDVHGSTRAAAGDVPNGQHVKEPPAQRQELIRQLQVTRQALYHRRTWLVLANPRPGVLGVIALIDPARTATETDLAALE